MNKIARVAWKLMREKYAAAKVQKSVDTTKFFCIYFIDIQWNKSFIRIDYIMCSHCNKVSANTRQIRQTFGILSKKYSEIARSLHALHAFCTLCKFIVSSNACPKLFEYFILFD
jgi:hypothetical protein